MAKLTDQLEKRLLELKQWHARKKLEEEQYRHGLRQQHPMASNHFPLVKKAVLSLGKALSGSNQNGTHIF